MNIQWYPGHMAKARRVMAESLQLADVVVELVDARAPLATRNPDFETLFAGKRRLLVLNKSDLADPAKTAAFTAYFRARGEDVIALSSLNPRATKEVTARVEKAARDLVERARARGMNKTVRAMIAGIPNVGKSTFINRLRGGTAAKVSDKPGVTRGKQWIIISPYLEFFDTPGMLWPKLADPQAAQYLAFLGSIRDDIMDGEALCAHLLLFLTRHYPQKAADRFKLDPSIQDGNALLEAACAGRGWLMSGARPDTERGSRVILDEFRAGKLGPLTLDDIPESPKEADDAREPE